MMCSICKQNKNEKGIKCGPDLIMCNTCFGIIKRDYAKGNKEFFDIVDITEFKTKFGVNAYYSPNGLSLTKGNYILNVSFKWIIECFTHESLHWVIDKIEGIKASYDWDNIAWREDLPDIITQGAKVS